MSDVKDYTVQVFKRDGRVRGGEKKLGDLDYKAMTPAGIEAIVAELRFDMPEPKYRIELYETWVTRTNIMSGQEFQERFDTPSYCSPASEAYFQT